MKKNNSFIFIGICGLILILLGCKKKTEYIAVDFSKTSECFKTIEKPILKNPMQDLDDVASTILLQRQYILNLETIRQEEQMCVVEATKN